MDHSFLVAGERRGSLNSNLAADSPIGAVPPSAALQEVMELVGSGLILTPVQPDDAERVFDAVQDVNFARWLPWASAAYTWEDAETFAGQTAAKSWASGQPVWAIREHGERGAVGPLCGVIDLRGTGDEREIGFWMHRDCQGRGLMTAAAALVLKAAFDVLGARRVMHLAAVGNERSRRIARNLGFVPEGVRRAELPDGTVERQWQSAILKADYVRRVSERGGRDFGAVPDAEVLSGSQPADLVAEFHSVYGMPNLVGDVGEPTVDFERVHMRMSLIEEEVAELIEAVYGKRASRIVTDIFSELPDDGPRDVVAAADALADLTYVVYGMALESGIDLDAVLAEVHSSNLSKLMPDGSVRRRDDGKILKGPDFREPNISAVLKGNNQ